MSAVDLFCGCGGASRGLHDAGFDVTGYDHWARAVETHNANGMPAYTHDLSNPFDDDRLLELIRDAVILWGSPPCQPFSAAGDGAGAADERDGLPWFLRIVGKVLAPVVIMENVKGLTFEKHLPHLERAVAQLRALGYDVAWSVLNCADYGVPQTRERLFVVARRDGVAPRWPAVTHTEEPGLFTARWVSMADALGWGMPGRPAYTVTVGNGKDSAEPFGSSWVRNRVRRERDEGRWVLNTGRDWKPGGTREDAQTIPADQPAPAVSAVPAQWAWTRPATTIAGDQRVFAPGRHDPDVSGSQGAGAIRVTLDELAALQGFPPDWRWCGNKTEIARQIGNAVPPRMAQLLAEANRPRTMR